MDEPTLRRLAADPPLRHYHDLPSQLRDHVYRGVREGVALGRRDKAALAGADQVRRRAQRVRERLLAAWGGLPDSATPLEARVVGTVHRPGCRIDKVVFAARPGVIVTGNLYLPPGSDLPAVLFLCGHERDGKAAPAYQAACLALAAAGLAAFAIDPVGQGERLGYLDPATGAERVRWGCPEHDHVGAQCLLVGDSSARYFVHDAMRALDYLATRPELDARRWGAMGNSGGGTQTALLMVADPRLAAAAPATYLTGVVEYLETGIAQDAEQVWPGVVAQGFDHDDLLLAFAPKPVLVLAARSDYFPIEGTRRSVAQARTYWRELGAPDALESLEFDDEHRLSPAMAAAATDFFSRRFLGRPAPEAKLPPALEASALWCFPDGRVAGPQTPRFVFDENLERYQAAVARRKALSDAARRERARAWLGLQVPPSKRPLGPKRFLPVGVGDLAAESWLWWSDEGLYGAGLRFAPTLQATPRGTVLAVWDGGTASLASHHAWLERTCAGGEAVVVVDLSGIGALEARPVNTRPLKGFESTYGVLAHDLFWQGDSFPALRARDVARALEAAAELDGRPVARVHARGDAGVCAALAVFAQDRRVTLDWEPPADFAAVVEDRYYDHTDILSRVLPGMLDYFDLSDLARWLGSTT